jgi:hypothetical protein
VQERPDADNPDFYARRAFPGLVSNGTMRAASAGWRVAESRVAASVDSPM